MNYDHYAYADPEEGLVRSDAIEGQRSCPFKCHFCFRGVGTTVRERHVKDVADELEYTYRKHNLNHAIWFDDTMTMRRDRTHELCDEILRRGIKMSFYCFTAANTLRKDLLQHMKQAGFTKITLGIESGNPDILKSVGKAAKLDHYVHAYEDMESVGIETRGSVILGHPYENHKTVWETVNFITEELRLQRVGVNILMPFPGTRTWFQTLARDGIGFAKPGLNGVDNDWSAYKRWGNAVVETTDRTTGGGLSREDLIFYQKLALMMFNTHPRVVQHAFNNALRGNTSEYYHRPVTSALAALEKFKKEEKVNPHRFSNGMTINEVLEDIAGNPQKYEVKEVLAKSRALGIKDAAPESFSRAPAIALPASGAPALRPLQMAQAPSE